MADYGRADLERALKEVGLKKGDALFSLSNLGFFGVPEGGLTKENLFKTSLEALQAVVGPSGTIMAPAFTYSFCRGKDFDPDNSPSDDGLFPEMLRKVPGAIRSEDPLFSVVALGGRAQELTKNPPEECFGRDSIWERLIAADGIFLHLNFLMAPPILAYWEKRLGVKYRQDRAFEGFLVRDGKKEKRRAVYFSRDLNDNDAHPYTDAFEKIVEEKGLCKRAKCGRGSVLGMRAKDFGPLIEEQLKQNPLFLTRAGR